MLSPATPEMTSSATASNQTPPKTQPPPHSSSAHQNGTALPSHKSKPSSTSSESNYLLNASNKPPLPQTPTPRHHHPPHQAPSPSPDPTESHSSSPSTNRTTESSLFSMVFSTASTQSPNALPKATNMSGGASRVLGCFRYRARFQFLQQNHNNRTQEIKDIETMIEVLTALAARIKVFTDLSERLISMESRNERVMAWVTGYEERIAEVELLRRENQEVIGKMKELGWHFWELVTPSATLLLLMEEKGQFVAGRPGLRGVDSEGGNLKKWQVVGRH